jgi:hypothetical protein
VLSGFDLGSGALTDTAPLQHLDEQDHNHDDQKQVHEITRDAETEAQSPHQQQDEYECPQHKSPLRIKRPADESKAPSASFEIDLRFSRKTSQRESFPEAQPPDGRFCSQEDHDGSKQATACT